MIKQRRTDEEAVFISRNGDAAPVEDQFGTFPNTSTDPVKDVLSAGSRYQRPERRVFVVGRAGLQMRGLLSE